MEAMIDITLPADQLEGTTAKISHWLIESGEMVNAGDPVVELETDKVSMEICAPVSGRLTVISKHPGDDVEANSVIGQLQTVDDANPAADANDVDATSNVQHEPKEAAVAIEPVAPSSDEVPANSRKHLVGPAVRRLLREHKLNIDQLSGTGRDGRVTRGDVQSYLARSAKPGSGNLTSREIPHTSMRKAIARHMVDSLLHTSPHVTSVFEMDMSNIIEHRRWHKKDYLDDGVKLTFTAYFLAATVKAMAAVPQMNARYHENFLELFEDINIGVGTALGDDGLVVPVVKQVQNMKLFDIAKALQSQTEKARLGKITPADMKNGTFTISNHGVSGSLFAAPIIINQPQVAILGIGKMEKRVVVREVGSTDEIQIKPMCYVSLSIDHRAVDAFQTNQFLSVFVETIESWGT